MGAIGTKDLIIIKWECPNIYRRKSLALLKTCSHVPLKDRLHLTEMLIIEDYEAFQFSSVTVVKNTPYRSYKSSIKVKR